MSAYFVSGIGTDVGKTIASIVLCEALNAGYWKPVQAGTEETDIGTIQKFRSKDRCYASKYVLKTPASPHLAAAIDGVEIDIDVFKLPNYSEEHLIVEGAGGLHVPLNDDHLIIDLIQQLDIPVILVSKNYLGSINHTLLSIEALQSRNIPIVGIIFNGEKNRSTEDYICQYTGVTHLGRLDWADEINEVYIQEQAKKFKDEKVTLTY